MIKTMMKLKKITNTLLTLIYPEKCVICDEVINISENKWICKYCKPDLDYIIDDFEPNLSVLYYNDKIKKSIYRFKYDNCKEYSKAYSILMYNKLFKTHKYSNGIK